MESINSVLFLAALVLVFVLYLGVMPAVSKMWASRAKTAEARQTREAVCLMLVAFLLILTILAWRAGPDH